MQLLSYLIWVALSCATLVATQRPTEYVQSSCPTVSISRDFNSSAYLGAWFEVRRYPARFQQAASCVSTQYSLREDGNITVLARMFNATTKKYVTMEGKLRRENAESKEAKLLVSFTHSNVEADYWVLGTDYTSYAVIWWCRQNTEDNYSLYSWILSRTKKLTADGEAGVKKVLADNGISYDSIYITTKQENCPSENGDI